MPSTFFGLTIATSGIYAAQASLDTTSHNISNAQTTGYSRQVANQQAAQALRAYSSYGMIGAGVEVTNIEQKRNQYYDIKYWDNSALLGEQTSKKGYLLQIEDCFSEVKVSGFTSEYGKFFTAINNLTTDASNSTVRDEVVNYAQSFTSYLNEMQSSLKKLQEEMNTQIGNKIDQINTLSEQIVSLNSQINTIELNGSNANDLRDRRAVLLDSLSAIIPISVTEETNKNGSNEFKVKMGDYTLIENNNANSLRTVSRTTKENSTDVEGLYDIYISYDNVTGTGTKLDLNSGVTTGELKALYDLRDGNNGEVTGTTASVKYKGIPYYLKSIQEFNQTFANEFNAVHASGYNLYKGTGVNFFEVSATGEISVNQDIVDDPSLIAANTIDDKIQDGVETGSLAKILYALKNKTIFGNATSQEYLESIVSEISIDTQKSSTFYTHYTNIKNTIANQRLSISGVDSDEESMNLVKYQEAYNLSAKMIQVMSEIYDKLINQTGV